MTNMPDNRKYSKLNIIFVLLACLASLATLGPDYNTGRARAMVNAWNGEPHVFTVNVLGAEKLIPEFDISATHHVKIEAADIAVYSVNQAIWTLRVDGNDSFFLQGSFITDNQGGWYNENNIKMDEITADLGPICTAEESDESDCIPCSLTEGCNLVLEVDLCQPPQSNNMYLMMFIEPEGDDYDVTCHKSNDQTPCQKVNNWMAMESTKLDRSLCENTEVDN